ncbi:MAG: queuosine precursor transporter [Bifidobacteriaceae bacterium]|jgi:uncharacterized integral membrane protein (TIGR00697 family)|nr:queuosine precursor transporter [Bifidobacteriaceae bacterium]
MSKRIDIYLVLSILFVGILLISNIAAVKLIQAGPFILDGGAFLFPFSYILCDIITEIFGFKKAQKSIILGFILSALASLIFLLVQISPSAEGWNNQESFVNILGFVPKIVTASLSAYFIGQMLNSYILIKIKTKTGEKKLWLRLIGSTFLGEIADTAIFCTIAFYGTISGAEFTNYILVGYIYKCLLEIVLLPITYKIIKTLKKHYM